MVNINLSDFFAVGGGGGAAGDGFTGSAGFTGSVGFTGSQGAGFTGSKGDTGFTGSQGVGFTGSQGAGFTGSFGNTGFNGSIGFTGSQGVGFTGSQGVGFNGSTGFNGSVGFIGSEGNNAGLRYNFSTTTTDADPGTGTFRFNNATIASVTQIYIDLLNQSSLDFTNYIDSWDDSTNTVKGFISVDSNSSADVTHAIFRLNTITTATGYRKLNVTFVGGTAPSNAEACVINFMRAGDVGFTGSVSNLFVGTTAPASPATGAIWVDTN